MFDQAINCITIAVHTFLLWLLIWRETSLMMRWLMTMLIGRIAADYILMTPMSGNQYFYCYYIFETVGFVIFFLAWIECKKMITKSFIMQAMLIYLAPEVFHVGFFFLGFWRDSFWDMALRCADILRPVYLSVLLYMCGILYRRKGNYFVND